MILALLIAGVAFREIPIDDPVLDVRIADIDADGTEEIVAVTKNELLIIGAGVVKRVPVSPVTIVGRGLLFAPKDSLLGGSGHGDPVLLMSPGDLDGDGKDDPVYATAAGISTPAGLVEWIPSAKLEIKNAESFAVEYALPVPAVGNWTGTSSGTSTGRGNELILYEGNVIRAFAGLEKRAELAIPLKDLAKKAEGIRRNKVFVRDIDNDGRLDLLLVMAKGSLRMFSDFEVTVWHFPGGRVYNEKRKGFYRPASAFKLAGTLLGVRLLDVDGDGDLDLSMATASTSLVGVPTGQYNLFRCEDGKLQRKPTWKFELPVPITAFKRDPVAPVDILPDFDGDGLPELVARGIVNARRTVRLFRADKKRGFVQTASIRAKAGVPAIGKTSAVMITKTGLLVVEKAK